MFIRSVFGMLISSEEVITACWQQINHDMLDQAIGEFQQRVTIKANGR